MVFRPAQADVLSFLQNLLGFNHSQQETAQTANSQTISLLESAKNSDNNIAKGGGDITIVNNNALLTNSGPLGTIADVNDASPSQDQISIYVVRQGDSLSGIAKMFDVSVNTIMWANDIRSGSQLQIGQTLVILPVSGVQYTVKKGDNIKDIAQKFNSDADEILQFNGLAANNLTEGQVIIIPNGEYSVSPSPSPQSSSFTQPLPRSYSQPSYAGYYMRPIEGGRKTQGIHGYNAVDLATSCGEPIFASVSGDVIVARSYGWNAGYGSYVVISHPNGTQTLYAHMSRVIVSVGWHVAQGQVIGYIGTTGRSTGCHVHFEIRGARNPF